MEEVGDYAAAAAAVAGTDDRPLRAPEDDSWRVDPALGGASRARVRFGQERPETVVPVGHPQGDLECFDAFVGDTYTAIAGGRPEGLPRFADGLRAARITDAVLASSATGGWVDV